MLTLPQLILCTFLADMDRVKYNNAEWGKCARTGGVSLAIVSGVTGLGQGAAGVETPCRGCWIQTRDANETVKMSIGTPASAIFGVELAEPGLGAQPLWVPVADVSELHFYSAAAATIDITFLLG